MHLLKLFDHFLKKYTYKKSVFFTGQLVFRQDVEAGVVGHIPYELSGILKDALVSGDVTLKLMVTDDRRHRSNRAGGLVIKCRYLFEGNIAQLTRLLDNMRDKINEQAALQQQIDNL